MNDDNNSVSFSEKKTLKLFLSYPHTIKGSSRGNICIDIHQALIKRGHEVWIDTEQLGSKHGVDWRRSIADGIENSQAVLSCLNSHAVRTTNGRKGVCLDELSIAISVKGGNIKTILLENESIVKPNSVLSHRQWLDMSEWRSKLECGEDVYHKWFNEKMEEVFKMLESNDTYEFDGEITAIRNQLPYSEYQLTKNYLLDRPFYGREWLSHDIDLWINDVNGGSLCVLYGAPGSGKSAFAVQYAFTNPHVAALICLEHGNECYNSPESVIQSLAFQLACRLPDYRKQLLNTLKTIKLERLGYTELFYQLLINPLTIKHIDGNHEPICIIFDGLDECSVGENNVIASILHMCKEKFPKWLKILITSREDFSVRSRITPSKTMYICSDSIQNLEDIHMYISEQLKKIVPCGMNHADISQFLTHQCEGIFLYAHLLMEMIQEDPSKLYNLKQLPKNLNQIIYMWFERLFPEQSVYENTFRLPLGALIASPIPFPQEEWESLFSISEIDQKRVLRHMHVFLKRGIDRFNRPTISFEHKYIKDWITTEHSGRFYISIKDTLKFMANACFDILQNGIEYMTWFEERYIFDFHIKSNLRRELKVALNTYENALIDLYRSLCQPDRTKLQILLCQYDFFATLLFSQSHYQRAAEIYKKCISLAEERKKFAFGGDVGAFWDPHIFQYKLSQCLLKCNDITQAEEYAQSAYSNCLRMGPPCGSFTPRPFQQTLHAMSCNIKNIQKKTFDSCVWFPYENGYGLGDFYLWTLENIKAKQMGGKFVYRSEY